MVITCFGGNRPLPQIKTNNIIAVTVCQDFTLIMLYSAFKYILLLKFTLKLLPHYTANTKFLLLGGYSSAKCPSFFSLAGRKSVFLLLYISEKIWDGWVRGYIIIASTLEFKKWINNH